MNPLYDYALSFLGTPYLWGGSSRFGIDCSSLVIELLKSVDMIKGDLSADGLYRHFSENGDVAEAQFGALAFYGTEKLIKHVGFCIDKTRMIEAAHGNEWITNYEKAYASKACVIMSQISRRKDLVKILMPRYPKT